ncbi:hypothetical protein, partial [Streptomyces phaeoluteigriseus]|uniref:hypothetical protein n=1 Tax=Streptomyces phaeoluteigriseus TaxID=114686 RepID=UPI001B8683A1
PAPPNHRAPAAPTSRTARSLAKQQASRESVATVKTQTAYGRAAVVACPDCGCSSNRVHDWAIVRNFHSTEISVYQEQV